MWKILALIFGAAAAQEVGRLLLQAGWEEVAIGIFMLTGYGVALIVRDWL